MFSRRSPAIQPREGRDRRNAAATLVILLVVDSNFTIHAFIFIGFDIEWPLRQYKYVVRTIKSMIKNSPS